MCTYFGWKQLGSRAGVICTAFCRSRYRWRRMGLWIFSMLSFKQRVFVFNKRICGTPQISDMGFVRVNNFQYIIRTLRELVKMQLTNLWFPRRSSVLTWLNLNLDFLLPPTTRSTDLKRQGRGCFCPEADGQHIMLCSCFSTQLARRLLLSIFPNRVIFSLRGSEEVNILRRFSMGVKKGAA